jgi:hypothetical protein
MNVTKGTKLVAKDQYGKAHPEVFLVFPELSGKEVKRQ